jgi:hypothetical protein
MGTVMDEVLFLLENDALSWFAAFDDLGSVATALSDTGVSLKGTDNLGLGASGATGSYNAADLVASLQLERHAQLPEEASAAACLEAIDKTVGAKLDIFASGYTSPADIEWDSRRFRDLLVISAMFGEQSPAALAHAFDEARNAVDHYPDHLKSRYRTWVERVEGCWHL